MLARVFKQFWQDERRSLAAWIVANASLSLLMLLAYDLLTSSPVHQEWLSRISSMIYNLTGLDSGDTAPGWLQAVLFGLAAALVVSLYGVLVGSRLTGDEKGGMLTLLLSYPYPRWQLLLARWLVLAAGVFSLAWVSGCLALVWGLLHAVPACPMIIKTLKLGLVGLVWSNLALLVSVKTGRKEYGLAAGLGGFVLTNALVWGSSVLMGWEELKNYSLYVLYHHWETASPGGMMLEALALMLIAAFLLAAALFVFERSDLAG